MTDNEFDDIIKKRLHQHESQVPEDMWQRIAGDKKKRRFAFLLNRYTGTLILLLLVGAGALLFDTEERKEKSNDNITFSKPTKKRNDSINHEHTIIATTISNDNDSFKKLIAVNRNKSERSNLTDNIKSNDQQNSNQTNDDNNLQQQNSNDTNQQNEPENLNVAAQQHPVKQLATNKNDTTSVVEENENTDKISIAIFVSPDLPFSKITSSDAQYQNLLRNNIKMRFSYTLGLGISYHVNKQISLSTGIQYSRINESVSFNDSLGLAKPALKNHLNFINIPLTISYNLNWTKSFQTSINAGIVLNVLSHYKGSMPDAFADLVDISKSVYKNDVGVSIYAGINFSKSISKNFDVFTEPYFRYLPKNIANNQQQFSRKINTAGIELGVRYNLFKKEKEQ